MLIALTAAACSDDAPGGAFELEGSYLDWDSTDENFLGIEAEVFQEGDPKAGVNTAPNGRSILTVSGSRPVLVFDAPEHLRARYSTSAEIAALGLYQVHGITEARIETFLDELDGLAWDDGAVLVEVEVRSFPSLDPADGVTVTVGGADGYHRHGDATWSAGPTVGDGGAVIAFPNVAAPEGEELAIEIDAGGRTCHVVDTLKAVAGELAMTTVACED
jgi:hypothetical protein